MGDDALARRRLLDLETQALNHSVVLGALCLFLVFLVGTLIRKGALTWMDLATLGSPNA